MGTTLSVEEQIKKLEHQANKMIIEDEAHRTYEKRCIEIQKLYNNELLLAKRERDDKIN